jgi:hypothetical protein
LLGPSHKFIIVTSDTGGVIRSQNDAARSRYSALAHALAIHHLNGIILQVQQQEGEWF